TATWVPSFLVRDRLSSFTPMVPQFSLAPSLIAIGTSTLVGWAGVLPSELGEVDPLPPPQAVNAAAEMKERARRQVVG
ncbi:hypothetical protein Q6264_29600, partial [Klebsiella pneumoniae]|nr:hypothetical protein [Klebsiella pneumoniae]